MGLDINLFREQNENGKIVLESQRRRGKDPQTVQVVIDADNKYREGDHDDLLHSP